MNYSFLMSVYYKEKAEWLKQSIDSMLQQSCMPSEIVIVKDGPLTPELEEVLDFYAQEYPRLFNIVSLEKNLGLGLALAYGIEKCSYEYIARMDSDDISEPNRCECLMECFKNDSELAIVGCYEAEFEKDISKPIAIHRVPETNEEIYRFMKRRCALLHPTVIYKKSAVIDSGNYRDVRLYEDYDLFMRMVLEHRYKAYNVQKNLYNIRINADFYKRRGGVSYLKTACEFKFNQYKRGYISRKDFVISAGSQALVCLMPNGLRRWVYMRFLRK